MCSMYNCLSTGNMCCDIHCNLYTSSPPPAYRCTNRRYHLHAFFTLTTITELARTYSCAFHPQEVDLLIHKWDTTVRDLEIAEAAYEKTGCTVRPMSRLGFWSCCGEQVDTIDHLAGEGFKGTFPCPVLSLVQMHYDAVRTVRNPQFLTRVPSGGVWVK